MANSKKRSKDKGKPEIAELIGEGEQLKVENLQQVDLEDQFPDLFPKWSSEKFSISFLVLHFMIIYPITGYKATHSALYVILLTIQEFLVRGFTYLSPIFVGYINIHLGAVFLATKLIQGPMEEREGIAAFYGRITYLLLRTKEFEWIKDNISHQYYSTDTEIGHASNQLSSLIQWSIVIVFLAVPRGLIVIMFGLILAFFFNPVACKGDHCVGQEEQDFTMTIIERLYTLIAQYFTFATQMECITALVAYCTGMTLLLYLSRYTRVGGQTLQELCLLLFGGFGLLAIKPFVGIMMALLSLCLTNSEFYKAVILGEDREKEFLIEKKTSGQEDPKEDPKVEKRIEFKNKISRSRNLTSRKANSNSEVDDIMVEFLPLKVPEANPTESLFPTGQGGIPWNRVMAIVLAVYFPYYDYSLSTKMRFHAQRYEYATILVCVVHPIVP